MKKVRVYRYNALYVLNLLVLRIIYCITPLQVFQMVNFFPIHLNFSWQSYSIPLFVEGTRYSTKKSRYTQTDSDTAIKKKISNEHWSDNSSLTGWFVLKNDGKVFKNSLSIFL